MRSPNPAGGPDAVYIMHTPDPNKSDLLAGLMLRCSKNGIEVLIVSVKPFPPRDHPKVTVETDPHHRTEFSASVVTPGALVLLPPAATSLAEGPWKNASELSATVKDADTTVSGVVPLAGLESALGALRSSCPPQ